MSTCREESLVEQCAAFGIGGSVTNTGGAFALTKNTLLRS
jgi:hypothetical protein